jgi:hypothetical protein
MLGTGTKEEGRAMRFAVGLKLKGKADHIVVDAEDALIAALKAKLRSRQRWSILKVRSCTCVVPTSGATLGIRRGLSRKMHDGRGERF